MVKLGRNRGSGGAPRDSDGDDYSDIEELLAVTNPNDPDDYPYKLAATPESTTEPTAPAATPTPKEPGFESVFAIAGLVAVAYLVRKLEK